MQYKRTPSIGGLGPPTPHSQSAFGLRLLAPPELGIAGTSRIRDCRPLTPPELAVDIETMCFFS